MDERRCRNASKDSRSVHVTAGRSDDLGRSAAVGNDCRIGPGRVTAGAIWQADSPQPGLTHQRPAIAILGEDPRSPDQPSWIWEKRPQRTVFGRLPVPWCFPSLFCFGAMPNKFLRLRALCNSPAPSCAFWVVAFAKLLVVFAPDRPQQFRPRRPQIAPQLDSKPGSRAAEARVVPDLIMSDARECPLRHLKRRQRLSIGRNERSPNRALYTSNAVFSH